MVTFTFLLIHATGCDNPYASSSAESRHLSVSSTAAFVVVGNAASPNAAEVALRSRLETLIGSVAYVDDDEVSASAVTGCQIVVVSKTVSSTKVGSKLKSVSCGVLFWEDNLQKLDMMATITNDGSSGTHWESSGSTLHVRSDAPSELTAGLTGTIDFYTASGSITHSPSGEALPAAAIVVAEMNEGSSRKAIYAYDEGQPIADGTLAAGRRVYFGLYDDTFDNLAADGLKLFDAAVNWAGSTSELVVVSISGTTDGLALSVVASATNPDNIDLEYRWVWGDGTNTGWSPDSVASHSYAASGTYTVQATVRRAGIAGVLATDSMDFTVEELTGVRIGPGEDIQSYVDSNPEGTTFILEAGTHPGQRIEPKSGQTFVGEDGAILDGQGADFAFRGMASNVTIQNLVIEGYAPGAQMGALKGGGHSSSESTEGWTIEGCEIRYNVGGGIRTGNRMRILNNNIHHNHQIGIVGRGDSLLVEGNEIAYNNWLKEYSYGFEAGGTKFVKTTGLVVRNNWSHHNWGPGLWTDIDNIDTLIEGNTVEDNADTGIFHEISYAAVIRNNTVRRNGYDRVGDWAYGAGILVAHSPDVEVYGNILEDNMNGIMGIQQDRGSGDYGPHTLDNLYVHDNQITQSTQWAAGVAQDIGDTSVFSRNLRFDYNTYVLEGDNRWFAWANGSHHASTWRESFGMDVNGSFTF